MNRRDIFKGGAGAAAALTIGGADAVKEAQYRASVSPKGLNHPGMPPPADPLWQLRQVFIQNASEERDKMQKYIQRRIDSLNDLKSVSNARRRYQQQKLYEEQNTINQRFHQLMNF